SCRQTTTSSLSTGRKYEIRRSGSGPVFGACVPSSSADRGPIPLDRWLGHSAGGDTRGRAAPKNVDRHRGGPERNQHQTRQATWAVWPALGTFADEPVDQHREGACSESSIGDPLRLSPLTWWRWISD